ncbi:tRNA (adenosine(37)-N6)-threonylcarbamoyltransferase complex ATPase subunit type 1 TsaE [Chryseolinea sp. Jin1]|uniref:tRNA threonylcarbamoyladenosine biosynthesis protein TsaE n=2 Tax=Chryseolinea lacunae TaxID=2801331 RepID=A0ABS1KX86_9BACT|nr:tRNA (adenosine(37)-N6)-threonylcarbamoyltransferase complex ATPase subunit type 1 TsaE [Chryseolinea lacunae]
MPEEAVFRSVTQSDLADVAKEVVKRLNTIPVWLFHGEMGSGKTTFIKAICRAAGVEEAMSSPTFSIVNEYETREHSKIYHFDFYRIKHEAEAYDIGTEEYFYSGYPCFIEWPEKIPSLIPGRRAKVSIQVENNTERTIVISVHEREEENRV